VSHRSPEGDWTRILGPSDSKALRKLPFRHLSRIPPAKREGLPLGHELRILGRFVTGGTSSLDPSALSAAYLRLLRPRERQLFRALVAREPLPPGDWGQLLGDGTSAWEERGLLVREAGGLRSAFAVVPVGSLLFAVDPQEEAFPAKVHIGQDSLNLLGFLSCRPPPPGARILDVGTGSGILLIGCAGAAREALGVDLNPRAVRAARFNTALNGLPIARAEEQDIFACDGSLGRFDRVIWNAPFIFYPEAERERNLDGYGGELGIGITLSFLEKLPELVADEGAAVVMTAAPVLVDGENRLETELRTRCPRLGFDATVHVLQSFWVPHLAEFHESYGIDRFESVILEARRGVGSVERRPSPGVRRLVDAARGLLYRRRAG
jgi:hypothetical protein